MSTKDVISLIAPSAFCLLCQLIDCSLLTWIIPTLGGSCAKILLQIECTLFSVITDIHKSQSASPFHSLVYIWLKSHSEIIQLAIDILWHPVLLLSGHMSMGCLLTLQSCSHIDIHGICCKHSTLMPSILIYVLGSSFHFN